MYPMYHAVTIDISSHLQLFIATGFFRVGGS